MTAGVCKFVVIEDQRPLVAHAVGVGQHVFVYPGVGLEVVETEVGHVREEIAAFEQGDDLPLMALQQRQVGLLVPIGPMVLHPVLLFEPLELTVADHGQAGHGGHDGEHAEVFVALAELQGRGLFVGVGHEVDVAFEDFGIEGQGFFDLAPVFGVVLVPHHVHEGAVVDAVHPQGADEVAFHEPEGFGQEQGVGGFGRNAIHHFPPEFLGHAAVEFLAGHGEGGAGGDGAALAWFGPPQALNVAFGQGHGRVEADDGELAGDVEDGLDDGLAGVGVEVVELGRVVPGHGGAVVAVVDVALLARGVVHPLEDDRGVAVVVVVVFQEDADAGVVAEVGPVEGVVGEGAVGQAEETVGVFDDPSGVDGHVVGDHVGGQADAPPPRPFPQVGQRGLAPEVVSDDVVVDGVGGGDGLGIAHHLFDALGGAAAFPQADEPQARNAAVGQRIQLLIGDLVQAGDGAAILAGELPQPDVGVFGQKDDPGHPVGVGGIVFGLLFQPAQVGGRGGPGRAEGPRPGFFGDEVEAEEQFQGQIAQPGRPVLPDVAELAFQGVGRGEDGFQQHVDQAFAGVGEAGLLVEEAAQALEDGQVGGGSGERGVVEEVAVGGGRGVLVGDPEEDEFLQRSFPMRKPVAPPFQPLFHAHLAPIDGLRGEVLEKGAQRGFQRVVAEAGAQVGQGPLEEGGVRLPAIALDEEAHDLAQETEGVDIGGAGGGLVCAAGLVHAVGEALRGAVVGDDGHAVVGEEVVVEVIAFAGVAGNEDHGRGVQ